LDPLVPNQVRYQTAPHSDEAIFYLHCVRIRADWHEKLRMRPFHTTEASSPGSKLEARCTKVNPHGIEFPAPPMA
jgi:hypothetical protein